jgi:hypothetical protein
MHIRIVHMTNDCFGNFGSTIVSRLCLTMTLHTKSYSNEGRGHGLSLIELILYI